MSARGGLTDVLRTASSRASSVGGARLVRAAAAAGLAAALAGCGSASAPGGAASTSTPATAAAGTPTARAGATVVLVRSGGLLPGSAAVRVAPDGTVRQGTSAQALGPSDRVVPAATLARLQAALHDPSLRVGHPSPDSGCCDRRVLVLTVTGAGPTFTVTIVEGDPFPTAVQQVLDVLVPLLPQPKPHPTVAPR